MPHFDSEQSRTTLSHAENTLEIGTNPLET